MSEYFGVLIVLMIKDCCLVGIELFGNILNFVVVLLVFSVCREKLNWLFIMGSLLSVMDFVIMMC